MSNCRVIVISGPSGSGKTRLATTLAEQYSWPFVNLDDFYFDLDAPGLPRFESGEIDWDDAGTWNRDAAFNALKALCLDGTCHIPEYSISESRALGFRTAELDGASFVVAEGIFAPEVISVLAESDLLEVAWCLHRNRTVTAMRRFIRDVAERRKPLPVLIRRGWRLWRDEPAMIAAHTRAGATPTRMQDAERQAAALAERNILITTAF